LVRGIRINIVTTNGRRMVLIWMIMVIIMIFIGVRVVGLLNFIVITHGENMICITMVGMVIPRCLSVINVGKIEP
jgi:hypothetical protein